MLAMGIFRLLVACGVLAAALPVLATTVFLEQMTSPEVAAAIRGGKTTIIVPIGGTEQNGPHMALGKHNRRVEALSGKIAAALGNALVAPVIAYVPEGGLAPPTGHMRYPGTISVPAGAYRQILEGAARSFKLHGFRDIVFLGDHGDYQGDNNTVATTLSREWAATPVRVHAIREYYDVAATTFAQQLAARGYTEAEIGRHAGLPDTALTLALAPELVRGDLMRNAPPPASGVSGDPRRATAELGQTGVDAIVAQTVAAIQKATRRP
jgi:creatinine amidohydrolase/Fe(II)-dependent formamide hydrolase-like protein